MAFYQLQFASVQCPALPLANLSPLPFYIAQKSSNGSSYSNSLPFLLNQVYLLLNSVSLLLSTSSPTTQNPCLLSRPLKKLPGNSAFYYLHKTLLNEKKLTHDKGVFCSQSSCFGKLLIHTELSYYLITQH